MKNTVIVMSMEYARGPVAKAVNFGAALAGGAGATALSTYLFDHGLDITDIVTRPAEFAVGYAITGVAAKALTNRQSREAYTQSGAGRVAGFTTGCLTLPVRLVYRGARRIASIPFRD